MMRAKPDEPVRELDIEVFLGEATNDLGDWLWLWQGNHAFPVVRRPGPLGRLIFWVKRLLRPLVRAPQNDLWERQRTFNLALITHLERLRRMERLVDSLGRELQQVQGEILRDLRKVQRELDLGIKDLSHELDDFRQRGMVDLMNHTDALFSRLDQKLDRLRRRLEAFRGEGVEASGKEL